MKSEKEILERIEYIKTLSNGYGINERRIKELEWVLKASKLHQPTVVSSSENTKNNKNEGEGGISKNIFDFVTDL